MLRFRENSNTRLLFKLALLFSAAAISFIKNALSRNIAKPGGVILPRSLASRNFEIVASSLACLESGTFIAAYMISLKK